MKIFKCLSQNVSVLQYKEEKTERKSLLGFRQKKRVSKTKELSPQKGVRFISPVKENAHSLANAIKKGHTPQKDALKATLSVSSNDKEEHAPRAGESSVAFRFHKTCRTLPSAQSTPFAGKFKQEKEEDSLVDVTENMSDYLPSFGIDESAKNSHNESIVIDSSQVNYHNLALIASSSASDYCMDERSNSKVSMQSSFCNNTVGWSSVASSTICETESTTNSSRSTVNKGCSTATNFTDSHLQSSSCFTPLRSVPATCRPGAASNNIRDTRRKHLMFTTGRDTCRSTTAHRRDKYQKHAETQRYSSIEEQDGMDCESLREIRRAYDSVSSTGVDYDSTSSTGIDYDSMGTANSSQASTYPWSECPASPLELKYMYIEQLMSLELEFVDYMCFGIQKYSKPLLYSILTCHQHQTIFMNIEKLVKMSEANLKSLRDNAAANDSQTSEDQHMMLYLPAVAYDLQIHKQCQAYGIYGKGLNMSKQLLIELKQNKIFLDFVKSQHATREQYKDYPSEHCPSIWEFIHRPALHIQQLHTALYNILTVTPRDSHDAPTLARLHEKMLQCIQAMNLKKSSE